MVTPTGAAILATLARFETPAICIERVGYGFGRKSFPWPNCLRLCLGRPSGASMEADAQSVMDTDWVTVIESNIDTMTGESLGWLMERLLAAGAPCVCTDPDLQNLRARRAYAKAGFVGDEVYQTPAGPAVLMIRRPVA